MTAKTQPTHTSTTNACKLCAPLGACLAYRGVEGCIPFLHGSQGCATYIRRYMISHYREPMDIASSSFGEQAAIFGGRDNFRQGLENVIRQYNPRMIGIASTCLSETIGDDLGMYLFEFLRDHEGEAMPVLASVSTPSYKGTHADGFYDALRSMVETLSRGGEPSDHVNLISSMISPADIRHLKEIVEDFGLRAVVLPDYSDTLDGTVWEEYQLIPEGGTPIEAIESMGRARAGIELGTTHADEKTAGAFLSARYKIPVRRMGLPIGIRASDRFFESLSEIGGRAVPDKHRRERGRLVDAYADAHKYIFGKRAVVFGEEDFVVAMAGFLMEIGAIPCLCGSGGVSGRLKERIETLESWNPEFDIRVMQNADFSEIEEAAEEAKPDLLVGSSKGSKMETRLGVPLVRTGFPVHDRIGGARILHVGYRGTQQLFDRVVNAILEHNQRSSPTGYFYM